MMDKVLLNWNKEELGVIVKGLEGLNLPRESKMLSFFKWVLAGRPSSK